MEIYLPLHEKPILAGDTCGGTEVRTMACYNSRGVPVNCYRNYVYHDALCIRILNPVGSYLAIYATLSEISKANSKVIKASKYQTCLSSNLLETM